MATKQEIELAIRASDTTTKKTFGGAKESVDQLTASVIKQVDALGKGEASAADLTKSLNGLKATGTELAREQGLISTYESFAGRLDEAKTKAQELREAANNLKAAQSGSTSVTRAQATELRNLERDAGRAEAKVVQLSKATENNAQKLELAGIGTKNLAGATSEIAEQAQRTGTVIRAVSVALENYDTILEGVAQNARASAEADTKAAQERATALLREQAFISDVTAALREQTAAEKAAAQADEAQRIRSAELAYNRLEAKIKDVTAADQRRAEAAKESARSDEALANFRAVADDALAAERGLTAFSAAEGRASETTLTLRQSLNDLLAPAQVVYQTIEGIEGAVTDLGERVGDASKPFANYQKELIDAAKAQSAILNVAGTVDSFRDQADAVEIARAAFAAEREELQRLAGAIKTADAPSKELVASLHQQEATVVASSKALAGEEARLHALSTALAKAKIDTNDLTGAENRLRETAGAVAAAQAKLQKASEGNKGGAFAFLGLSPYALTNLGYQVNDVVTQLASGTSVEQTFAQQGGQILQIFPGIFSAIAGLIPIIAVVGVAFVGLYAIIKRAFDVHESIRAFESDLLASADSSKYSAGQLAAVTQALTTYGVSLADAREATVAFTKDGIDPERLQQFGQAAKDLSILLPQIKVPDAAKQIAEAFTGGYEAVAKLDNELHFLQPAERQAIRDAFDSGDAARARTIAFDLFFAKIDQGAEHARGLWSESFRALKNSFGDFLDSITHLPVIDQLIKKLGELADAAKATAIAANDARTTGATQGQDSLQAQIAQLRADRVKVQNRNVQNAAGNALGAVGGPLGTAASIGIQLSDRYFGKSQKDALAEIDKRIASLTELLNSESKIAKPGDRELLAKTAILENGQGGVGGVTDVASVVRNRALRSGASIGDTIRAQAQFEAVDTKGSFDPAKLNKVDTKSKQYADALAAVDRVLQGLDTVKGAVNYYAPRAQAALGRKPPGFDRPELLVGDQNGQRYSRGTFPGDRGRGLSTGPVGTRVSTETASANSEVSDLAKAAHDALVALTVSAPQERLARAREDAVNKVAGAKGDVNSPQSQAFIADSVAKEAFAIEQEQRELSRSVGGQLAAYQKSVQGGQDQDLPALIKSVRDQVAIYKQSVDNARSKGASVIEIEGVKTSVAGADQLLDRLRSIQEVTVTTAFYEKQLGDLTTKRAADIAKAKADLTNGVLSPADYIAQIGKITANYVPQFDKLAKTAHSFAAGIKDAKPNPAVNALIGKVDAAGPAAQAEGAQAQIAASEQAVNEIVSKRNEAFQAITDRLNDPDADIPDLIAKAIALQGTWNAKIVETAKSALTLAETLKGAGDASPQLQEFITKQQGVLAQAQNPSARTGPAAKVASQATSTAEAELNRLISDRNQQVSTLNDLEAQGTILDSARRDGTIKAYNQTQPLIENQIAVVKKGLDEQLAAQLLTQPQYDAEIAKLTLLGTQAKYTDENFTKLREAIIESLSSDIVQSIDSASQSIGNAVAGTESWGSAIRDLGRDAVQFFAKFLEDVANAILQMEALALIKNLPGLNGATSSILDVAGLNEGAGALGAAGGVLDSAAAGLSAAAGPLGIVAGALLGAATALGVSAGAQQASADTELLADAVLIHGGGVVGRPGGQSRSGISPLAFIGAPRYHAGTVVGIKSDEQAAILQKGEEVLSKGDPRNVLNGGGSRGGQGGPNVQFRHVLVQDPDDIPQAMAGAKGETVTITHIKRNAATIRQILKS